MSALAWTIIVMVVFMTVATIFIWRPKRAENKGTASPREGSASHLSSKRESVYGKPYVPPTQPKTRPTRTVDRHERVGTSYAASPQRNDDDMLLNPLHPLSPLNPAHSSYSSDDSCYRHSDSGSSYSSSDSGSSSSSYDSGSSSSSDSGSSSSSCD